MVGFPFHTSGVWCRVYPVGNGESDSDFDNLGIAFFSQSVSNCVEKSHPMTSAGGLQRQPTASFDLTD